MVKITEVPEPTNVTLLDKINKTMSILETKIGGDRISIYIVILGAVLIVVGILMLACRKKKHPSLQNRDALIRVERVTSIIKKGSDSLASEQENELWKRKLPRPVAATATTTPKQKKPW